MARLIARQSASGDCAKAADGERLVLTLTAPDADSLAQLQNGVERHLVRFAFRAERALDWQAA